MWRGVIKPRRSYFVPWDGLKGVSIVDTQVLNFKRHVLEIAVQTPPALKLILVSGRLVSVRPVRLDELKRVVAYMQVNLGHPPDPDRS
jgi:hypothetical protein